MSTHLWFQGNITLACFLQWKIKANIFLLICNWGNSRGDLYLYLHLYLHLVPRSEQSTVSVAKHIFSPNGGYCVYYPSNIFRNVRSFGNWGIFNNNSPKWRWLANIQRLPPTLRWIAVLVYTKTVRWYTPQQINLDVIFSKLLGGKKQRIFGVWRANQRAPSTLSTVLVYTNVSYLLIANLRS